MKTNDGIVARTHKEFLNTLLGLNLKGYQKSSKSLDDGKLLWMIRLNGEISNAGWRNYLSSPDEIIEEYCEDEFVFESHYTYVGRGITEPRVVFDVVESFGGDVRYYTFRGVFIINKEKCTLKKNVWRKVSDKYDFYFDHI